MYNVERFRPRYDGKLGDPMLLVGLRLTRSPRRARPSVVRGRTGRGSTRASADMSSSRVAAGDQAGLELRGERADRQRGAELRGELERDARGPCGGARP